MVATRRGTRVSSPEKNTNDEAAETPGSTIRRTRSRTVIVPTPSQSEHTSDSQQDEAEEKDMSLDEPAILPKKETRSSKRRPTNKQPESTHEADVSESESCCSVTSDVHPTSGSTRRASRAKPTTVEEQKASKAESSSSSLGKTPRRSTRGQNKPVSVLESTTSQEDEHSEAESCSSVVSLSRRLTRSHVKRTVAPADAAHSEADSCSSVVSGPQGSTVRRSTRSRVKVTEPIPIHLEHSETTEASAALEPRRTRGQRGKAKSAEKDQADDSDGCHSRPSLSPKRTTRSRVADSDSESVSTAYTSLDSPCSPQGRGTPCSSRTGSASSNRALRVSRSKSVRTTSNVHCMSSLVSKSVKKDSEENEPERDQGETTEDVSFVPKSGTTSDVEDVEKEEDDEEDTNNKTVIAADQDCSVSEDNNGRVTITLDETEAQVGKSESRRDTDTEKDVKESLKVAGEPMETHGAGSIEELEAIEEESSCVSVMPQESFPGADQSKLAKEQDTDVQQRTNTEGPSSSSEVTKTSIEKTKPVKECVSLLDSSEDEGSDDDDGVLSVDGGNDEAGDLDSEDEMCCSEDQPGPSGAPDSLTGDELFVIDARPGYQPSQKYYIDATKSEIDDSKATEEEEDFVDEEGEEDDEEEDEDSKVLFTTRKPALTDLSSSIDPGLKVKALGGLYINFDGSKSRSVSDTLKKLKEQKNQDELLKKSVIVADFEKKDTVPPYKESKHAAKLKRKEERAKTTGDGWFNMRAPELTEELKNDLKALQMRSAMDPKRFYKKNDREALPKYFQVGTVVDNPIDFYHSRIPKKERKRTIVEELLADAEFRSFNKRKYREIIAEKAAAAAGKMNKKRHKLHKKK